MNVFIQTHTNKFFKISMPPKSKPKFIQQHDKLPTLAKFMSHQHCPSYTMNKKYNDSKMLQSQDYNMVNHAMPQISTRPHNNTMTMSQHQILNGTWKQHSPPPPFTLKSMWECGAWVLGSWRSPSSSFHSSDGWYFFPWKVRKEGPLEEDGIVVQRKWKFGNGFHKMGV